MNIKSSILSDHSLLTTEIQVFSSERGPGLFRFRNDLLRDEPFFNLAKVEIQKEATRCQDYSDISDWGLTLDILLSKIRVMSIRRWKEKNKQRRDENSKYIKLLEECEAKMNSQTSIELIEEYQDLKTTT